METRKLGLSDIQITPIIMGTWQTGKAMWVGIDDAESIKALRGAFDAGILCTGQKMREGVATSYRERVS
jgi:aryl-alcohol dehydrogenase-like predicted oxidoreductase